MRIHLIAVGTRMPGWVDTGYREYAKRMPRECSLQLLEIPACKRQKSRSAAQAREVLESHDKLTEPVLKLFDFLGLQRQGRNGRARERLRAA